MAKWNKEYEARVGDDRVSGKAVERVELADNYTG